MGHRLAFRMLFVCALGSVVLLGLLRYDQPGARATETAGVSRADVVLLGKRSVAAVPSSSAAGRLQAFRLTASRSGSAGAAHVYLRRSSRARTLIVAVYTNSRGHPAGMLTSGLLRHLVAGGWNRIAIRHARARKGSSYWLALLGNGGTLAYRAARGSGCHSELARGPDLRRPPARWRWGQRARACAPAAYLTAAPSGGSSPSSPAPPGGSPPATGGTPPPAPSGPPPITIPAGGCFASPGACGYPDPGYHNVGATSVCSSLPASGTITANTAGATIANLNVTGRIIVAAPNVTIDNVCVTYNGGGQLNTSAIHLQGGASNTTIEHVTVGGANTSTQSTEQAIANTSNGAATASDDYIYNCGECVWGGPWTVTDSYVITNGMQGTDDHLEDLYCSDESVTMTHDTLLDPADQNSVIFCDTHFGGGGPCDNHITVTNSLLAGGGFVIYTCGNASVGRLEHDEHLGQPLRSLHHAAVQVQLGHRGNRLPGGDRILHRLRSRRAWILAQGRLLRDRPVHLLPAGIRADVVRQRLG